MKITKNNVSVSVSVRRGVGKVRFLTDATVKVNGRAAAFITLGGRYDQQHALAEFRKSSARFQPLPGWNAELLGALAVSI